MQVSDSIAVLPKTHKVTLDKLNRIGIHTIGDLIAYRPKRYVDYSITKPIGSISAGEIVTVCGRVQTAKTRYIRRNFTMQEVIITDTTGSLQLIWFNQPYIVSSVAKVGMMLAAAGEAEQRGKKLMMKPLEYERIPDVAHQTHSTEVISDGSDVPQQHTSPDTRHVVDSKHTGTIVPMYSQRGGISTRLIREKIHTALTHIPEDQLTEWLPPDIVSSCGLISHDRALRQSHKPSTLKEAQQGQERLVFDEFFTIHLAHALVKRDWQTRHNAPVFHGSHAIEEQMQLCIQKLPFILTPSQIAVWDHIQKDMMRAHPMNRFLQGDVGSGKTVVATLAAYRAHLHGYRTLIMCPTQILATQHFKTLSALLAHTGVRITLVTGTSRSTKKNVHTDASEPDIIIGTHALLTNATAYRRVGLIVIDEQHRFGVVQRALLKEKSIYKASQSPHLLTMTATPIPRTVALTLFGDLDISVLTDMPVGRLPIRTYLAPATKRASAYAWIRAQIQSTGCQAFVVCPRIAHDDTDEHEETQESIKAVEQEAKLLQTEIFPDLTIGMLHGKMKATEKHAVMEQFRTHAFNILVTTTVVEVGIDIPNATIMIIEGAERYGLAQLHQLRGRVGRGNAQSYCVLFTTDGQTESERLSFFAKTTSGMELAEYDFRRRGPGNMYGTAQHGNSEFDIANLFDFELVSRTQEAAKKFVEHYKPHKYPAVTKRLSAYTSLSIAKD